MILLPLLMQQPLIFHVIGMMARYDSRRRNCLHRSHQNVSVAGYRYSVDGDGVGRVWIHDGLPARNWCVEVVTA